MRYYVNEVMYNIRTGRYLRETKLKCIHEKFKTQKMVISLEASQNLLLALPPKTHLHKTYDNIKTDAQKFCFHKANLKLHHITIIIFYFLHKTCYY